MKQNKDYGNITISKETFDNTKISKGTDKKFLREYTTKKVYVDIKDEHGTVKNYGHIGYLYKGVVYIVDWNKSTREFAMCYRFRLRK